MKKKKKEDLDFYYLSKDNKDKRVQNKKKHPKKKIKKVNPEPINDDMFNIDNEIVIGVTVLPKTENKNGKKQVSKNKKRTTKKREVKYDNRNKFDVTDYDIRNSQPPEKGQPSKKNVKRISYEEERKRKQRRERRFKIVKFFLKILLLIAIIVGVFLFLFISPVFNIKEVSVQGNNKINSEEIKSLSQLTIDENIFRFSSKEVEENVKENAYVDTVNIKRKLPNTVEITITERETKYQLEYGNAYIYIDKDGYILEISDVNANLPIIRGYGTLQENLQPGNKLTDEDCEKLITVEKFLRAAQNNGIYDIITYVDISDSKDYKIEMPTKGKIAYLGDDTNINDKMLILKEILTREEGKNGEVFINDLNKMFFREKV